MTSYTQTKFGYPPAFPPEMQWKRAVASNTAYAGAYPAYSSPNLSFFQNNKPTEPQKSFGDYLARTSLSVAIACNLLLFLSPWIAKTPSIKQFVEKQLIRSGRSLPPFAQNVANTLGDPKKLKELFQRGLSFSFLFQLNSTWQTGIQTMQPSKLLTVITGAMRESIMMCKVIPFLQAFSYFSNFLWFSGETNDIKNNNDPLHRREWDPRRLVNIFSAKDGVKPGNFSGKDGGAQQGKTAGVGHELSSLLKYLMQDYKYALSYKPWQGLVQSIKNHDDPRTPQPYQTALGAQFNMIAFVAQLASVGLENSRKKKYDVLKSIKMADWDNAEVMKKVAKTEAELQLFAKLKKVPGHLQSVAKIMSLASIISYAPIVARALKNKNEKDSYLTLIGVPMMSVNQVMLASREIQTLKGLFGVGGPMIHEGNRLNSKKYRAQVEYLQFLSRLAIQNPQLTASDVLRFMNSHPEELKAMRLNMGKARVEYLLERLQAASQQQQSQHVSLAAFLAPMMQEELP